MQRRDYLSLLPALFKREAWDAPAGAAPDGEASSFLQAYLSTWQALLSAPEPALTPAQAAKRQPVAAQASLGAAIQAAPGLFHPRLSPAFLADDAQFLPPLDPPPKEAHAGTSTPARADELAREHLSRLLGVSDVDAWLTTYLEWYGQMLDIAVPRGWKVDAKRDLLSRVLAVYRLRGTVGGLRQLLELLVHGEQTSSLTRADGSGSAAALALGDAASDATVAATNRATGQHLDELVQRALAEPDARLFLEGRIRALYTQLYGPDPGSYQEVLERLRARPAAATAIVDDAAPATGSAPAAGSAQDLGLPELVTPEPAAPKEPPLVEVLDGALGLPDTFRLDRSRLLPAAPKQELDGYDVARFEVIVIEPTRQIARLLRIERWLTRVIDTEKPLGTRFRLHLRTPTLVVGDSRIGVDTVLGDGRLKVPQASAQGVS